MGLNKSFIIGNLTRDPENRYLPSGKPVANLTVAANRKFKQNGETTEETEYFNVVMFGRLAEIATTYLKKGREVFVEGRIRTRSWTDNSGIKHYRTELIAESMKMFGGKGNGKNESADAAEPPESNDSDDPGF